MARGSIRAAGVRAATIGVCWALATQVVHGAGASPPPGGPIHGVKVLSDQVDDLSSLEAIRAHLLKLPSDAERAAEIFRLSNKYRHQANPPHEFLGSDDHVHEPVKIFNVYGYCKCCCAAALLTALGRAVGMPSRGWSLTHHSVSEVFYDRSWHMFDLSLMNYFITDDGRIAGVPDLIEQKGRLINRAHSPFIDERNVYQSRFRSLPPGELSDYEVEGSHVYEYTYTLGHRIGLSLRAGESIVRRWGNSGRHINENQLDFWQAPLDDTGAVGSQLYLKDYYPGYRMGLVGNGELTYALDFAGEAWRGGLWRQTNTTVRHEAGGAAMLALAKPGRGSIVVPFASSYVLLGGTVKGRFVRGSDDASIRVSISRNHGLDWETLWTASERGTFDAEIDLTPWLFRRYQYLLRVDLEGRRVEDAGVLSLSFADAFQHAQRALPLLARGGNRITVEASDPTLATLTIEGALRDDNELNASYLDFHPVVEGLEGNGSLFLSRGGGTGTLTVPVEAPGPIRAARFGGSFRARDPRAGIRLLVSDDAGRTWKVAGEVAGPFEGFTRFAQTRDLARGARRALVRYEVNGPPTAGIFVFRIDVDYLDPLAAARPIEVVYEWTENGAAKSHHQVVSQYPFTYTIDVAADPIMKSIAVKGL